MIVSPKKFQTIVINRQNRSIHNCLLTINNAEIKSRESVTLLGIKIDNKLNFEKHVSTISKKANNKLNAKKQNRHSSRPKGKRNINKFFSIFQRQLWPFYMALYNTQRD